jgi:4-amino-4-deoxy-L-arabinose transferase-like glycosyltransferase
MEAAPTNVQAPARLRAIHAGAVLLAILPVAITVLAAVARLAALSSQPGGLYPDEGAEALDAHRLLTEPGFHPVFFQDDAGREAMYGYMVAAAFRVMGESVVVLRGVSAVLGVLGVVAVYLALRRFGRGVALAGMAWSAGALWLLAVSRDGMRNVTVPVFGALALWVLLRWSDRPGRNRALLAGAAVGAGLWTYQPLKLTPILVALWLAWMWWRDRPRFRLLVRDLRWMVPAFLVVSLPMLVTAVVDPAGYFGRAVGVSPLNPVNTNISLLQHTLLTLGMWAFNGDPNARHNVGGLPLLGWPLFILALLGAYRACRDRDDPGHVLLLLGIPIYLLPPLVGIDGGAPHFLRSLGLAPYLAGLIGLGAVEAVELARRLVRRRWAAPLTAAALATLLLGLGIGSASAYFGRPIADRYDAYNFELVAAAEAARAPGTAIVIDDYSAIDVRFLDAGRPPDIYAPGSRIDASRYRLVVGVNADDLSQALGGRAAVPISCDAQGRPRVYAVRVDIEAGPPLAPACGPTASAAWSMG